MEYANILVMKYPRLEIVNIIRSILIASRQRDGVSRTFPMYEHFSRFSIVRSALANA